MAQYPIYNPQYGIYNQNNFSKQTSGSDALTVDTGKLYFLQFPNAQTTQTEFLHSIGVASDATFNGPVIFNDTVTYNTDIEFLTNVTVDGDATVQGNFLGETATFGDVVTCEKGIDISVAPYGITFPDNTTQTTAFIEANYAQLNTDNTFLAPYVQTFQQNNTTGNTSAPVQIINVDNNDNIALYIDPSAGNDLTLYSNQATGGLTVRNPNASFTLNPVVITAGIVGAQTTNPIDMNGYNLLGLNNVYADGASMTFNDSTNSPMLLLTNGGHTSYENLNMNNNTITNATSVSSPLYLVGANGQIGNSASLNPQILTIRNTALNNTTPQIYFQINDSSNNATSPMQILWDNVNFRAPIGGIDSTVLNVAGTGITVGAVPLKVNTINTNGQPNVTFSAGIDMGANNIINCGSGSTGTTASVGDNSTKLATTAFVQANTPSTANFAQLTTTSQQTFTGPNNFTGTLQSGGVLVATVNNLPYNISTTISNYTVNGSIDHITLNSGFSQQTTNYPSNNTSTFFSNPFTITINSTVPYGNQLFYIQFNQDPMPNFPPQNDGDTIMGTSSTGQVNSFGYAWGRGLSNQAIFGVTMGYNVGVGSVITFNLASLGLITN